MKNPTANLNHNSLTTASWRSRIGLVCLFALLLCISAASASARGCTAATIAGSYGVLTSGTEIGVGPLSAVGIWTFSPTTGAMEFSDNTVNTDGVVSTGLSTSGTYTLGSNCGGTITYSTGEDFAFVVVQSGNEIDAISENSIVQAVVAKKINALGNP